MQTSSSRSTVWSRGALITRLVYLFALMLCLHITLIGTRASPVKDAVSQSSGESGEQNNEDVHKSEGNLVEQLWKRTEFPDYPPSCQICEMHYDEIDSCANASVVFANVSVILFDPFQFLEVINCACADTFQSSYPQCVDCFMQTNQTGFLEPDNGEDLNSVVTGIRQICALGSTIFGGVASVNSQLPGQTPITVNTNAALKRCASFLGLLANSGEVGIIVGTMVMGFFLGVWTLL